MELLIFLVARREQLVTRQDIVTKLWRSDLFVDTEANINNVVRKIRTALGDSTAKPRFLETVIGKGYRFIGPVRVIDASCSNSTRVWQPMPTAGASPYRRNARLLPYCRCVCWETSQTTRVCVSVLQTPWYRALEILRMWMFYRLRQCWAYRQR